MFSLGAWGGADLWVLEDGEPAVSEDEQVVLSFLLFLSLSVRVLLALDDEAEAMATAV